MNGIYENNANFKPSRLPSLFSDYKHLEEKNNEGFKANLNAWIEILIEFFKSETHLCWKYSDLVDRLQYKVNGVVYKPMGLYIALNHLINEEHKVVPLSEYSKSPIATDFTVESNSGIMKSLRSIVWPYKYSNRLTSFNSKDNYNMKDKYMLLEKLIDYSNIIKSKFEKVNDPIEIRQLYELVRENLDINKEDFDYSLVYLERDIGMLNHQGQVVFLQSAAHHLTMLDVNEKDQGDLKKMASLNYVIYQLKNHSQLKQVQLNELHDEIILDLRNGSKASARMKQKRNRIMKSQLDDTLIKIEQLHILKLKMEQAENNRLVMGAFELNSKILKELNDQMESNNVDNVVNSLVEEIDRSNEISDKLSTKLADDDNMDDDIDKELEALQKELALNGAEGEGEGEGEEDHDIALEHLNAKLSSLKIPSNPPKEEVKVKVEDKSDLHERESGMLQ